MHQLKKELALQETVWRDGGEREEEKRTKGEESGWKNKDTSHANWWTTAHVCLCLPELNCFNTVSKCVGVGRREEKTMHFFALQLSNRYANMPAALHLWAECLQGLRPAGTEVGWRVVSLSKRPWAWRGQVIITEINHTPATTERQVIRMNKIGTLVTYQNYLEWLKSFITLIIFYLAMIHLWHQQLQWLWLWLNTSIIWLEGQLLLTARKHKCQEFNSSRGPYGHMQFNYFFSF